jgi:hypothetical protein
MSLAARIAAHSRRPTATVRLGGKRWADVLTLSRDTSFGQGVSGGEVVGRNPPVTISEGETAISWTWGYDGYEVAGFTGVVTKVLQRSYPNQWRLQVADPLWLADVRRSDIATTPLNSIAASAAVAQILAGAGLTRLSIPALPASGSKWAGAEWVLGALTPVSWQNTTALAAAQAICEVLGYWLYCDASGVARAALIERKPSDSPFRTLRWGDDFLLAGPPERERDAASVKNRVVVRGANTGVQGAQIWDAWQTGDADRTQEYSSSLIEFVNEAEAGNASATGVAKRILTVWGRQPNVIRIGRLKADPRLAVGMTVAVQCSLIGYSAAKPFFIYSLSSTLDLRAGNFAQSLTLDGGVGDQGYTTLPPPEASFSWRLVRETLNGVAVVEAFLDGTGSHSLGDGEIVSYAWASATAVAAGFSASATGPRAMFVYPAATATASVTLTVTDTSSKTGAITQAITLAGDATVTPSSRVLSVALGAAWAATPDGGATWHVEATGDSTLVPELSDPLLSTRATGATGLRRSSDALATASTALASLGGAITALAQTPGTARVWAAKGASLYRSTDGGATFALWGTLPASIAAVLEDPAVPSSVFALAGANLYHATAETPGTGWSVLYAGPAGATARHLVRGESGATTWICYTGSFIGAPLQRVEGPLTASWPLGTAPTVAEVRAIALSTDELTCYAWDGQGRGWAVASETGIATAITATLGAGETAQHALCDPDEPIVYLASFGSTKGSVKKYFPLGDKLSLFYDPASGSQAHRVGVGAAVVRPATIYVLPFGVSGANDRIRRYDPLTGAWADITPPRAGWYWYRLRAAPFDPSCLLLSGGSRSATGSKISGGHLVDYTTSTHTPLYLSTDGGATWQGVTLSGSFGAATLVDINPLWSETTPGRYAVVGQPWAFGYEIGASYLWRLTTGATSGAAVSLSASVNHFHAAAGSADEVVVAAYSSGVASDRRLGYVPDGGALTRTSAAAPGEYLDLVRVPGGRGVAGIVGADSLVSVADYRAGAAPALVASGIGTRVAAATHGVYVARRGDGAIWRVAGIDGAPSAAVAHSGAAVSAIRSDAQSRTAVAGLSPSTGGVYVTLDGATWTTIGLPAGTLAEWIEVVVAGGAP